MTHPNPLEAIVLKVTPFQDFHQIVTLLTPERGIIQAIASYGRSPKNPLYGCFVPLNQIEVLFQPGPRELKKVTSALVLNSHRELRRSYDKLTAGCQMLRCITETQMGAKPLPLLFDLLKSYLKLLEEGANESAILASFQLKILRHEGFFSLSSACHLCGEHPKEMGISEGLMVCASHKEKCTLTFTEEETAHFFALALTKSAPLLKEIAPSPEFGKKVEGLFLSLIT